MFIILYKDIFYKLTLKLTIFLKIIIVVCFDIYFKINLLKLEILTAIVFLFLHFKMPVAK